VGFLGFSDFCLFEWAVGKLVGWLSSSAKLLFRFVSTLDYLKIHKFITYWSLEAVNIKKSLIITGVTNWNWFFFNAFYPKRTVGLFGYYPGVWTLPLPKNQLNFKISLQKDSSAHGFLPSFTEISKAKVTKRMCGINQEKKLGLLPLSLWLLKRSRQKILQDHSFRIPHPCVKFCPNLSSIRRDISENVFQTHYNNGMSL